MREPTLVECGPSVTNDSLSSEPEVSTPYVEAYSASAPSIAQLAVQVSA